MNISFRTCCHSFTAARRQILLHVSSISTSDHQEVTEAMFLYHLVIIHTHKKLAHLVEVYRYLFINELSTCISAQITLDISLLVFEKRLLFCRIV